MLQPLSNSQIVAITHKRRYKAQVRALRAMQIDVRVRPDGSPLVFEHQLVEHPSADRPVKLKLEALSA